ncbi:MAG: hypothetical protein D6780_03765 [Candidatus Dadabacteria bacterium]|nr:MAG: hypothetical protein D6780_03765 [Candidatus Dadabacteria bacterium]
MTRIISKEGKVLPLLSWDKRGSLIHSLTNQYLLKPLQIAEQAGLGLSMVVRAALGLDALEGRVLAIADNTLSGVVVQAAARQILQAGAEVNLWKSFAVCEEEEIGLSFEETSKELSLQLKSRGVEIKEIKGEEVFLSEENLKNYHLVLLGINPKALWFSKNALVLNESAVPVHCVDCPWGVDPRDGTAERNAIFSSSTLFLGLPFEACLQQRDFFGRLYLTDISCPLEEYRKFLPDFISPFSAQPVVQLFLKD